MQRKITIKKVFAGVRLSLIPIWGWPVSQDATKFKLFCVKLHHCLSIITLLCLQAPLLYSVANHLKNLPIIVNQIVMTSSIFHSISNYIFHLITYHHLQSVTFEMVDFCALMKPHEEIIIQQYIDKCFTFYSTSMLIFYITALATVTLIPPLMHQPFPTLAEYPFDVSYQPLKTIIFLQQSASGIFIAAQLCINVYMALLLWFATARFEILAEELKKTINVYQLFKCIKTHQHLLQYAEKVALIVRPIALATVCCSTVGIIVAFLLIISNQPLPVISQFVGLVLAGLAEVFMYTWPAEYLMYRSKNIGETAFHMLENNNVLQIWKCLQIIIMRSQKPVIVSVPCFMPTLSLNYFSQYLSTILSYFTTLRVMIIDN